MTLTQKLPEALRLDHIFQAVARLKGHVRYTPCHHSKRLSNLLGFDVHMKMENMQHTGAYKERGALNKLLCLTEEEKKLGVFAASAGNHAQGLSYHAGRLGIKSTIFMPNGTPVIKVTRTMDYGADVKLVGSSYDDAFEACMKHIREYGGTLVHPFDDYDVMAGQGTIGLELLQQLPDLDAVVVPVGGGGIISGIATALKLTNPHIQIIGVEPERIPSMSLAVRDGRTLQPPVATVADGINVRLVGEKTTEVCKVLVDDWVTVSEEDMFRAMLLLLEGDKAVTEGAGAAGVAALMSGKLGAKLKGKKVATVISGGNIDINVLSQVIEGGLVASGRRIRLLLDLADRPGTLATLITRVSAHQANIISINHERTCMGSFGAARVILTLDVRGNDHAKEVLDSLRQVYGDQITISSD